MSAAIAAAGLINEIAAAAGLVVVGLGAGSAADTSWEVAAEPATDAAVVATAVRGASIAAAALARTGLEVAGRTQHRDRSHKLRGGRDCEKDEAEESDLGRLLPERGGAAWEDVLPLMLSDRFRAILV